MKVLVTGSEGFIGKHTAQALRAAGHHVIGYDILNGENFTSGELPTVDAICHIGAIGDVYACASDPVLATAVNAAGTAHVANEAKRMGARLVYASTWEVYDYNPGRRLIESDIPQPTHSYNATKYLGETLARFIYPENTLSLRLGTAYGPGLRPNSVFRIFARKGVAHEPLTIQGTGEQGREFIHVRDVAAAFVKAIESNATGSLNITGDEYITIKALALAVSKRFDVPVTFGEARPGDVHPALVDNSKAKAALDWQPAVPFEQGLAELLELEAA